MMIKKFRVQATAAFGIESVVADEVKALGFDQVTVENGRVEGATCSAAAGAPGGGEQALPPRTRRTTAQQTTAQYTAQHAAAQQQQLANPPAQPARRSGRRPGPPTWAQCACQIRSRCGRFAGGDKETSQAAGGDGAPLRS